MHLKLKGPNAKQIALVKGAGCHRLSIYEGGAVRLQVAECKPRGSKGEHTMKRMNRPSVEPQITAFRAADGGDRCGQSLACPVQAAILHDQCRPRGCRLIGLPARQRVAALIHARHPRGAWLS